LVGLQIILFEVSHGFIQSLQVFTQDSNVLTASQFIHIHHSWLAFITFEAMYTYTVVRLQKNKSLFGDLPLKTAGQ